MSLVKSKTFTVKRVISQKQDIPGLPFLKCGFHGLRGQLSPLRQWQLLQKLQMELASAENISLQKGLVLHVAGGTCALSREVGDGELI